MANKISIIGAGNMGGALYAGLKEQTGEKNIFVYDHNVEKVAALNPMNSGNLSAAIEFGDIIVIAVKPQSFSALGKAMDKVPDSKVVLSIMAGVTIKTVQRKLRCKKVVRAMPNLPLQVKASATLWTASKEVDKKTAKQIGGLLGLFGASLETQKESMLDAFTALAGSGPAYFFYLTELLAEQAKVFGFSEQEADEMAKQTLIGSAELLKKNDRSAAEWRQAVTSRGGTTEAALKTLRENGFERIFFKALEAAKKRSGELNLN